MAKVLFREQDISGEKYRKMNAKSKIAYRTTGRTIGQINSDVLKEYVSLKLANVSYGDIAPAVILGHLSDDSGRLFLITEMQGTEQNESFQTPKDILSQPTSEAAQTLEENLQSIDKDQWKALYALTVGLLNDSDTNKSGNIGIKSLSNGTKKIISI